MNKNKFYLAIVLLILGLIGVASILTMEIPLPEEAKKLLENKFTPNQIKWLLLINPTITLLVAVIIGILLYDKVNFKVPVIEKWIVSQKKYLNVTDIVKYGVLGGLLSGFLLGLIELAFSSFLPEEFIKIKESVRPTLAVRFLYGGITEEILMRFGFMTLIVWVSYKIFKTKANLIYLIGIFLSALIFAIGHFPIAYQVVKNPSIGLSSYILIGNSIGGIIFGWLYWKKGLESAFIAHIFTHIVFVIANHSN